MKLRILVVDDNYIFRHALKAQLQVVYEATVVEAAGALRALELADGEYFDLILMDVAMPGMDGIEACAAMRKRGIRSPIILMSAFPDYRNASAQLGVTLLRKPLDQDALRRVLLDCT